VEVSGPKKSPIIASWNPTLCCSSFTFKGPSTKRCVFANPQKMTTLTCYIKNIWGVCCDKASQTHSGDIRDLFYILWTHQPTKIFESLKLENSDSLHLESLVLKTKGRGKRHETEFGGSISSNRLLMSFPQGLSECMFSRYNEVRLWSRDTPDVQCLSLFLTAGPVEKSPPEPSWSCISMNPWQWVMEIWVWICN